MGQRPDDPKLADNGWIDLRASNWARWRERLTAIVETGGDLPGADHGSRLDVEPTSRRNQIRPGRLAAWVFRYEDQGERVKR